MKKLLRRTEPFKGWTIGLDLHKRILVYSVHDRRGDEVGKGQVRSGKEELIGLTDTWRQRGPVQVVLEASGCFLWAYDLLAGKLGKEFVHVAQPSKVRVIAESQEKTDANDAWWLAHLLWEGRMPEAFVAEGTLRDLRTASRELRACTDERSDLLRRFNSHFTQEGYTLPKAWHTSRKKREVAKGWMRELKGERASAVKRLYIRAMRLSQEVQHWQRRVTEIGKSFPAVEMMKEEMPGFGDVVTGAVYGEMGDPSRYRSAKAYGKATGLTPGYRESGGKRVSGPITRAGSRLARWAYTRAAVSCLRRRKGGPGLQIRAWIMARSKNRAKKKVIVAAARKLAEGVWRMFALGEAFDIAKAFPISAASLARAKG